MTTRKLRIVASALAGLGLLVVGGCTDAVEPSASFETEGWIDTMPPGPPGPKPGLTGGDDQDEEEDDEGEEDDGGGEEAGAYWGIYGTWTDGVLGDPGGEFFAEVPGQVTCEMFFPVTILGPAEGCSECTTSWQFQLGAPEIDVDVDGACGQAGQVEGTILDLGMTAENVVMRGEGGGWVEIGEAITEDGELILEWQN